MTSSLGSVDISKTTDYTPATSPARAATSLLIGYSAARAGDVTTKCQRVLNLLKTIKAKGGDGQRLRSVGVFFRGFLDLYILGHLRCHIVLLGQRADLLFGLRRQFYLQFGAAVGGGRLLHSLPVSVADQDGQCRIVGSQFVLQELLGILAVPRAGAADQRAYAGRGQYANARAGENQAKGGAAGRAPPYRDTALVFQLQLAVVLAMDRGCRLDLEVFVFSRPRKVL